MSANRLALHGAGLLATGILWGIAWRELDGTMAVVLVGAVVGWGWGKWFAWVVGEARRV